VPRLVTADLRLAVALPAGPWAIQSAYLSGSVHVVICRVMLLDPLTAVIGGDLLVHTAAKVRGSS